MAPTAQQESVCQERSLSQLFDFDVGIKVLIPPLHKISFNLLGRQAIKVLKFKVLKFKMSL